MANVIHKVKEELLELLPPTLYFFVTLHIVAFIRALMNLDTSITLPNSASVTVAALILGKAVLLADMLPFINRFPEKPLIWNVGWKTVLYSLVATLLHYLERLFDQWRDAPNLAAANRELLERIVWPHFLAIEILLVVLVVVYCTVAELARLLGSDRLKSIFFGPLPALAARSH
jgi:hypothetical protein